jgi:hypothetical protein
VTRRAGSVVVLDTPFYASTEEGEAMVREKRCDAGRRFGERADALLAVDVIEFLTRGRLERASRGLALGPWRRHRVWYPLWYELRGLRARLRGARTPSRFDLWEAVAA